MEHRQQVADGRGAAGQVGPGGLGAAQGLETLQRPGLGAGQHEAGGHPENPADLGGGELLQQFQGQTIAGDAGRVGQRVVHDLAPRATLGHAPGAAPGVGVPAQFAGRSPGAAAARVWELTFLDVAGIAEEHLLQLILAEHLDPGRRPQVPRYAVDRLVAERPDDKIARCHSGSPTLPYRALFVGRSDDIQPPASRQAIPLRKRCQREPAGDPQGPAGQEGPVPFSRNRE